MSSYEEGHQYEYLKFFVTPAKPTANGKRLSLPYIAQPSANRNAEKLTTPGQWVSHVLG